MSIGTKGLDMGVAPDGHGLGSDKDHQQSGGTAVAAAAARPLSLFSLLLDKGQR